MQGGKTDEPEYITEFDKLLSGSIKNSRGQTQIRKTEANDSCWMVKQNSIFFQWLAGKFLHKVMHLG